MHFKRDYRLSRGVVWLTLAAAGWAIVLGFVALGRQCMIAAGL